MYSTADSNFERFESWLMSKDTSIDKGTASTATATAKDGDKREHENMDEEEMEESCSIDCKSNESKDDEKEVEVESTATTRLLHYHHDCCKDCKWKYKYRWKYENDLLKCLSQDVKKYSGEWNLKECIQWSLYNLYSGGEVYSLLVNHTFSSQSLPF